MCLLSYYWYVVIASAHKHYFVLSGAHGLLVLFSITSFIIHQIVSLALDWSRRVPCFPPKTRNYINISQFLNQRVFTGVYLPIFETARVYCPFSEQIMSVDKYPSIFQLQIAF